MWFCDECGAETVGGDPERAVAPECPTHGPRWRLVRNAPCAEVVIVRQGRVLLTRRAREPHKDLWELPGGYVDRGEHPTRAAVREIREELGIDVVLTGLVTTSLEESPNGETLVITAYEGITDVEEPDPDPGEVSEWRWFERDAIPERMAGRDRDRLVDWIEGRTVPLPGDGL